MDHGACWRDDDRKAHTTRNVLEAERSLYTTEDALVQSQRNISLDLVALYKALGGGWELTDQHPDVAGAQP